MNYKTVPDMVSELSHQHAESTHFFEQNQDPECMQQFQEELQLLTERALAKEGEPYSAELEPSGTEETRRITAGPVYYTKEIIPMEERKWKDIPACRSIKVNSL